MAIRVAHNYGGAAIMGSYAAGLGKAKQRREKYVLDQLQEQRRFMQDLAQRRQDMFLRETLTEARRQSDRKFQLDRDEARRAHDIDRDRRRWTGDYGDEAPPTEPPAVEPPEGSTPIPAPPDATAPGKPAPKPIDGSDDEDFTRAIEGGLYSPENEEALKPIQDEIAKTRRSERISDEQKKRILDELYKKRAAIPRLSSPRRTPARDAEDAARRDAEREEDDRLRKREEDDAKFNADQEKRRREFMEAGGSEEEARRRYPDRVPTSKTASPFDTSIPSYSDAMKDEGFRKWLTDNGKNWDVADDSERNQMLREYQAAGGFGGGAASTNPTASAGTPEQRKRLAEYKEKNTPETAGHWEDYVPKDGGGIATRWIPEDYKGMTNQWNAGLMDSDDYLEGIRKSWQSKTISDKEYGQAINNVKRRDITEQANALFDALGGKESWKSISDVPNTPITVGDVTYPNARKAVADMLRELKKLGVA